VNCEVVGMVGMSVEAGCVLGAESVDIFIFFLFFMFPFIYNL
jgi:hypothetical protein